MQVSPVVPALPSSQVLPSAIAVRHWPVRGSQKDWVHWLPVPGQTLAVPTHLPVLHLSLVVQAEPSSHNRPSGRPVQLSPPQARLAQRQRVAASDGVQSGCETWPWRHS
jgi:hypothetical protein